MTKKVEFKTPLQKGNRIQVPRIIRWQFKLEPDQVLKIVVSPVNYFVGSEIFYGRMNKDGRITIPFLVREIFRVNRRDPTILEGTMFTVHLEPA